MIYDSIERLETYRGLGRAMYEGLLLLREKDFSSMADGRYPLDGERMFLILERYTTKAVEDTRIEAHRDYIDIQYLLSGEECIGVGDVDHMQRVVEAHPEKDIWFFEGETVPLPVGKGRFLLLFPHDAHRPGICTGAPQPIRKAVVKIRAGCL